MIVGPISRWHFACMRQIITQTLFLATWASTTLAALDLAALRDGAIVLDANAIESEAYAAEEFQRFFEQASGVTLPIVTGGAGDKAKPHIHNMAEEGDVAAMRPICL